MPNPPDNLPPTPTRSAFDAAHEAAVAGRLSGYRDPATGYAVQSTIGHLRRGYCCGEACRHCPFEWASVTFANMPKNGSPPPPVPLELIAEIAPELLRT